MNYCFRMWKAMKAADDSLVHLDAHDAVWSTVQLAHELCHRMSKERHLQKSLASEE